jgi:hypothetical protein
VAALDPAPQKYYAAADIVGLVYNNPILTGRLSQYPPFLSLADKTEFQEIATDSDYNNMLLSKADFSDILSHPKTKAILQNPEILQELGNQDLSDLRQYLETGKSPKYDEIDILGRWKLDLYATIAQERKKNPNMSSAELIRLRRAMTEFMPMVTVVATPDHRVNFKAELSEQTRQLMAQATAPPPEPSAAPGMSPEMARRYGRGAPPRPAPGAGAPQPAAPNPAANLPAPVTSAQGSWEQDGHQYTLKLQNENGQEETVTATADDERLTILTPVYHLVFEKAE